MLRENVANGGPLRPPLPLSARLLAARLGRIRTGSLQLSFETGHTLHIGDPDQPVARMHIRHPLRLLRRGLLRGAVGFAESFVAGEWETPNLARVLATLAQNLDHLVGSTPVAPGLWLDRLRHRLRVNSRRGSRRNIRAHYDLSNAFYELWLDESMTYSSALFEDPLLASVDELAAGQQRKYARILELSGAKPGDQILEIGCGWGGFACAAAQQGVAVTGITLSPAQLDFARRRLAMAPLAAAVDLQLQDYRDVQGNYDHIVSVEMLEAVGEAYWPDYFATLASRLRPGGRAVLQVIVIDDARMERYRKQPDFIQMHIFPGGMLPSCERLRHFAHAAGLRWQSDERFGLDYAKTCEIWDQNVTKKEKRIRELGFSPAFLRRWHYYLRYCQAGFELGMIDVMHIVLQRPDE